MPQSDYIAHLEDQLSDMSQKNKEIQEVNKQLNSRVKREREQKISLYQEVQELKNKNPFKMIELTGGNGEILSPSAKDSDSTVVYKFEQQNSPKTTTTDSGDKDEYNLNLLLKEYTIWFLKDYQFTKQINVDYESLVKVLKQVLKEFDDTQDSEDKENVLCALHHLIINLDVDSSEDELIIRFENIDLFNENGGKLKNKMGKNSEDKSLLFGSEKKTNQSKSSENINNEEIIIQLRNEVNELKALLGKKEELTENNVTEEQEQLKKTEQKVRKNVTFRDIQNADRIYSTPSKKPKTTTFIKRTISHNNVNDNNTNLQDKPESGKVIRKKVISKPVKKPTVSPSNGSDMGE